MIWVNLQLFNVQAVDSSEHDGHSIAAYRSLMLALAAVVMLVSACRAGLPSRSTAAALRPTDISMTLLEATVSSATPADLATPTTTATSTTSPSVEPTATQLSYPYLVIDKIGVRSFIESVGVDAAGHMGSPRNPRNVAWYSPGFRWGKIGNAVIAGHLNDANFKPAIFWQLSSIVTGDIVRVEDLDGSYTFTVLDSGAEQVDEISLPNLFGEATSVDLNLITCHGPRVQSEEHYTERWIVYATLKDFQVR